MHTKCNEAKKPIEQKVSNQVFTSALPPAPVIQKYEANESKNLRVQVGARDFAWRSPGGPIANPNPMDSAFEMVDHVLIEAPDGRVKRIRVLHDTFGAPSTMADNNLASYSHKTGPLSLDVHTANTSTKLDTDEFVLKLILPSGKPEFIKTIATDMKSQRAFTVSHKTIDVPLMWNNKYFGNKAYCFNNKDLRFSNLTDLNQIELLLGSDNSFFCPKEIDRYKDNAGQCALYQSQLQNDQLLLGGGRIVGLSVVPTGGSKQRSFQVTDGNGDISSVVVRRTATNEMNDTILFPENPLTKMSKLDQKFFKEFEDNNMLPPHPRACKGCSECPTCSDVGAAEKRKAIEANLDKMCVLNKDDPWPKGGWHISLLWNSLKQRVPTNKEDSIRRFLATERALLKSPEALKTFNEQVKKCLDLKYFVLMEDYDKSLAGMQVSYLPLSYALKDTVEEAEPGDGQQIPNTQAVNTVGKTKARPVSDGSHRANIHTPSVNEALVAIPDLWTGKIQNLLLKFRTARRLAMADISQYFHRLRLDQTSVSMTRAIWRKGGIGGTGELTTMVVPSASMGLTPVPALASHCRARTADMVEDKVARESLKDSYCDDVYLPTLWENTNDKTNHQNSSEPDTMLIKRIEQAEAALSKAKLQLGGTGWVTDLNQETIPPDKKGITGVTVDVAHRDIGASTTGALGLRWSLGAHLPEGGIFSYRVHRPGSLNLLPKRRGKRPPEGEMRNRADIRKFLETVGITKAGLLSLVMNLFDVLQLAIPWTASAKMLYREILTENPNLGWKEKVPPSHHKKIEDLATDLLTLSAEQSFPRRALQEGKDGSIGHVTLILAHDASADSACVLAYIHQQWPKESVMMPESVTGVRNFFDQKITTKVRLLCGAHKLSTTGHEEQVASELLSATIAVKLKLVILQNTLIKFDKVLYLGDSLTVAKVLRKSNRAYNSWASARVSFIQRNEDLDNMFHVPGKFLVPTADKGTRANATPSTLMDKAYWEGEGTIDMPLHQLPITPPSQYTTSRLEELPDKWLHKAAMRLKPVTSNVVITCHRIELEETETSDAFQYLKTKYRSFQKLQRIMKYVLKFSPKHKNKSAAELMTLSKEMWFKMDYDIVKANIKYTKIPQTLTIKESKDKGFNIIEGRSGYKVPLIANPKWSKLARVIVKQYHDKNHLSSPAMIQALIAKDFFFLGGLVAYLKKLEQNCTRCRILRARPSEALSGTPPEGTQGPLASDQSIWRRWMLDICGPIMLIPWVGTRTTRSAAKQKVLKHWILVTVDLGSRQVDAVLLEGYSATSVLTGLRELTGRHGVPQHIYWDRASNLHAAGKLMKNEVGESNEDDDLGAKIKVEEELTRSFEANGVTVHLSIPYSSHRQGRVEAAVKRLKRQLVELCYDESQTKLTPMEVTSLLSSACNTLNNRPILLTAESTMEEKHVLCPSYLTSADINLQHTSTSEDPQTHRNFDTYDSPLTKRATMVQERLEIFKTKFNTFMTQSFASLGKFNKNFNSINVGDVVLILDKEKKTLPVQSKNRFVLGVVEEMISERSCKLRYIAPGTKSISRCERSIQGLSLIVRAEVAKQSDKRDVIIDPILVINSDVHEELPNQEPKGKLKVKVDYDAPEIKDIIKQKQT